MTPRIVQDNRSPSAPELTFLVPVYNEKNNVAAVLNRLAALPLSKEIVVVDDGSTDGTRDVLQSAAWAHAVLVFHEHNAGKGRAIQTALAFACGRYAAIQDADLEYDPEEYAALLRPLQAGQADVVYGSRFLTDNPNIYRRYMWGNKLLTAFLNLMSGGRYTDSYTCYKLMSTDRWKSLGLKSSGFEMEAEVAVKVVKRGWKVLELPIHYHPRRLEEGKKIGAKDALKGALAVLKYSLSASDGPP